MNLNESKFWQVLEPVKLDDAPQMMSFSVFNQIKECPLSWSLKTADYNWDGPTRKYPVKQSFAQCRGIIIHESVRSVLNKLRHYGISISDVSANSVIKELGGYRVIAKTQVNNFIQGNLDNPRFSKSLEGDIKKNIPDIALQIQKLIRGIKRDSTSVGVSVQSLNQSSASSNASIAPMEGLGPGSHPEVYLRATQIGWLGQADLIVLSDIHCQIMDYKSGEPHDEHKLQLNLYALIWRYDENNNPSGRLADRLTISYTNYNEVVEVPAPGEQDLGELVKQFDDMKSNVQQNISSGSPPANPGEHCFSCEVRQNCATFWEDNTQEVLRREVPVSNFLDVEVELQEKVGSIWHADVKISAGQSAEPRAKISLERVSKLGLNSGDRIRILSVSREEGSDGTDTMTLRMTKNSEVFVVPV